MGIEIPMDKRKRLTKILEKFIFPCLLLIYPLLWVNQGIDVSDPMYSLTNFRFSRSLRAVGRLPPILPMWLAGC